MTEVRVDSLCDHAVFVGSRKKIVGNHERSIYAPLA